MRGRASESWGIVAVLGRHIEHRDNDIAAALSRNSRTICHEIVHMWIGNLVTIKWWTSFWLSESLARFLEHKVLHALRPEFRIWHKFQQEIIQPALEIDGSDKSHELEIECQDPEQLDSIYDTLAYGKGTSVICMLEELIGADNFRRGMADLIATNEYRSIDSAQFWSFMTSYSQYSDLAEVFLPWVFGTGFPLLLVSRTVSGAIFIEQRRFLNSLQTRNSEELWFLPLTYISDQEEGTQKILFKEKTVELTLGPELRWFACNLNRVCFIRVKYSDELLLAITEPVKKQLLSAIDIFGILDDHFLFYQSGSIKYTTFKELLLSSAWCKELIVCEKRLEILRYLWRYLGGRYLFKSEVQTLARSLFESCLLPPVDCIDRDSILGLALRVLVRICDDEDTKSSVCSTFLSKPSTLSPELYQVHAELFFLCSSLERVLEVARTDLKLQYTAAQSGSEEVLRYYFGQFIAGRLHGLTFKHTDTFSMLKVMLQLLVEYSEIPEKWTQVKDSSFSNACVDALSRCMTSIYARAELDELLESIQALDSVRRVKHEKWLEVLVNSKEKLIRTYNSHQRTIDPMQAEILKHIST